MDLISINIVGSMVQSEFRPVRRLLVGSDLSTASDRVIAAADRLAKSIGGELHVISAYAASAPAFAGADAPPIDDAVRREVTSALPAQLRRILPPEDAPASAEVRFGRASEVLLARTTELGVDLLVVGAHRGPEVDAQFLGTTADEVLRGASVPCLVIRSGVNLPIRRIALALDPQALAAPAVSRAVELGSGLATPPANGGRDALEVVALTVRDPGDPGDDDSLRRSLLSALEEAIAAVASHRPCDFEAHVMADADPAEAIARWTARNEVDLVVVGTRRQGRSPGLLGSTASAIARRAPSPVLLIPPSEPVA